MLLYYFQTTHFLDTYRRCGTRHKNIWITLFAFRLHSVCACALLGIFVFLCLCACVMWQDTSNAADLSQFELDFMILCSQFHSFHVIWNLDSTKTLHKKGNCLTADCTRHSENVRQLNAQLLWCRVKSSRHPLSRRLYESQESLWIFWRRYSFYSYYYLNTMLFRYRFYLS